MAKNFSYKTTKNKDGWFIVEVLISADYFGTERNSNIEKLGADVEIKGFRKGQVPISALEGRFGNQATLEVVKKVSFQVASEIMKDKKEPILSPLNIKKVATAQLGKTFEFEFEFLSAPEISLKDLKKIKVDSPGGDSVTDDEVDKVIEEMWTEQSNRLKSELTKGTSAEKTTILGPDGKPMSEVKKPSKENTFDKSKLTDEWASQIDKSVKSLSELKSKIKSLLLERKKSYSKSLYYHNLFERAAVVLNISAPSDLVEAEMVNREEEFYATARLSGATPVEFLRSQGLSIEKLRDTWKKQAESGIKQLLIITGVGKAAGIEISEAEIEKRKIKDEKSEQTRIRLLRDKVIEKLKSEKSD